jgi:hypothetical protein
MCTKRDRREGLSVRWMLTGATGAAGAAEASLAAALWALAREREELVYRTGPLASCVCLYLPPSMLEYGWIPVA